MANRKHLLQFPNATPVELLVIIHDSIQVNKDMASQFYSTQTPASLPILSLEPEMICLCHVCAKKG